MYTAKQCPSGLVVGLNVRSRAEGTVTLTMHTLHVLMCTPMVVYVSQSHQWYTCFFSVLPGGLNTLMEMYNILKFVCIYLYANCTTLPQLYVPHWRLPLAPTLTEH